MIKKSSLTETIREDKTYKSSKKTFERIMQDLNPGDYINELFSLHTSRAVNAMNKKRVLTDALSILIGANVSEILTRSRLTTIQMSSLQALIAIEELTSHLTKYLLSKYGNRMKAEGHTTMAAQKAQVDVYIRRFLEVKKQLENVDKLATMALKDIDQSSYSLMRIQDAIDSGKKDR